MELEYRWISTKQKMLQRSIHFPYSTHPRCNTILRPILCWRLASMKYDKPFRMQSPRHYLTTHYSSPFSAASEIEEAGIPYKRRIILPILFWSVSIKQTGHIRSELLNVSPDKWQRNCKRIFLGKRTGPTSFQARTAESP